MTSQTSVDVLGIFAGDSPEPRAVLDARSAVQRDPDARRRTVSHLGTLPAESKGAAAVRRGIALFVLGRDAEAATCLAGSSSRVAKILRARALAATGRRAEAVKVLGDVKNDADAAFVAGECLADLGDEEGLAAAIAAAGAGATGPDFVYLRGRLAQLQGEREAGRKLLDDAASASPPHVLALFRAGLDEALYGDEDEAIRIYRECVALPMAPRNAWLNLGNLYEDRGEFTKARDCFRAVIDADPTDPRARMFERDALASQNMFYDEDFERRSDKRSAILRLPVTDFELSVRSRNCLAKMGVRTLGDLVQKTEAELLSYKNFGETSLQEIKDVLAQKGLRLGMTREEIVHESDEARTILEGIGTDTDRRKILQKPLSDLELSVRSRHCMNVLGLKTIGDLAQRSEADLMTIKNFGQTSLNEVKQKLAEIGLTLAPSPVK